MPLKASFLLILAAALVLPSIRQAAAQSPATPRRALLALSKTDHVLAIVDAASETLVLQASAGMYIHLDGPHSRVKVGDFKIGRIACDRRALLTNDVRHDPNIGDPAWAEREGMVAFAGYPLLVDDRVVGVLAIFWRQAVSEAMLGDLAPIADGIAQCVLRKEVGIDLQRREQTARFLA